MSKGYLAAAFLLALAIAGGLGYWRGSAVANTAAELVMTKHLSVDREAENAQLERVRVLNNALTEAEARIAEAFEEGKRNAERAGEKTAAELRAGVISLQHRWSGCQASRMSDSASSASKLEAAARDREESAGRIVAAAASCDAHVLGLQQAYESVREQINKQ